MGRRAGVVDRAGREWLVGTPTPTPPIPLPTILPTTFHSTTPIQHIDTGELLMQAFADRAAVSETLQTGCVWEGVLRGDEFVAVCADG